MCRREGRGREPKKKCGFSGCENKDTLQLWMLFSALVNCACTHELLWTTAWFVKDRFFGVDTQRAEYSAAIVRIGLPIISPELLEMHRDFPVLFLDTDRTEARGSGAKKANHHGWRWGPHCGRDAVLPPEVLKHEGKLRRSLVVSRTPAHLQPRAPSESTTTKLFFFTTLEESSWLWQPRDKENEVSRGG